MAVSWKDTQDPEGYITLFSWVLFRYLSLELSSYKKETEETDSLIPKEFSVLKVREGKKR